MVLLVKRPVARHNWYTRALGELGALVLVDVIEAKEERSSPVTPVLSNPWRLSSGRPLRAACEDKRARTVWIRAMVRDRLGVPFAPRSKANLGRTPPVRRRRA
jgi:hypothetical protein